jgi:hypothetical protein
MWPAIRMLEALRVTRSMAAEAAASAAASACVVEAPLLSASTYAVLLSPVISVICWSAMAEA